MKIFLLLAILFYKCNNLTFAIYETVPATLNGLQKLNDQLIQKVNQHNGVLTVDGELVDPISSIDIDYLKNGLIFQFRRSGLSKRDDIETRRRSPLDRSFMRLGRSDASAANNKHLMRFGRAGGNNRMRFGKRNKNLMRFGRSDNKMRFGKRGDNLMRFGRTNVADNLDKLFNADNENSRTYSSSNLVYDDVNETAINEAGDVMPPTSSYVPSSIKLPIIIRTQNVEEGLMDVTGEGIDATDDNETFDNFIY